MPRPTPGPKLRALEKRGGVFYIFWTDESTGRSRERSTGTRDHGEATAIFAEWLSTRSRPLNWTGPRRASEARIADVLTAYAEDHVTERVASKETALLAIETLLKWWGDRTCDFIKPETCRAYVRSRVSGGAQAMGKSHNKKDLSIKSTPVRESTAARELTVLRAALGHAHKNGKLLDRPFVELPARPPGRDRWLTRNEAAGLLWASRRDQQARGHLPLFILLGVATGARRGALFDLRWTQIDFDRDRIDFNPPDRKQTAKRRPIISIPRRLRWFLLRAHARATSPYVLSYQGRKLKSVRRAFRTACTRAGLGPDVIPYTLRHTAGTWLAQAGVDLRIVGGWLGHSSQRTTELYAHHHPSYLTAARKVMD